MDEPLYARRIKIRHTPLRCAKLHNWVVRVFSGGMRMWLSNVMVSTGKGSMMPERLWAQGWVRHVAIAIAYCAALVLFRQLSIPHWIILTGFHLSALLLTRYKYWPALIAGGVACMAYVSIACVHQFGWLWAAINLVPSICYFIPIVWMFRERWRLFPQCPTVNMAALVLCSLLIACMATAVTLGQILITPLPPGYVIHYQQLIAQLTLGHFLGILTITPATLVFQQRWAEAEGWRRALDQLGSSRLAFDIAFVTVPGLAFLVWIGVGHPHVQQVAQMATFLPVIWLALRHGWKGAAIGGTLASIGVMLLMPARNDPATLQAETLVAMAITTMLLVGSRITALDRHARQERTDTQSALALAQRNANLGEVQLKSTALFLDQLWNSFHSILPTGPSRSPLFLAASGGRLINRRQALATQDQLFRLVEGLYPYQIGQGGLAKAMCEGQLARVLDESGVDYWCETRGQLHALQRPVEVAVYRIVTEALADACLGKNVSEVHVTLRSGQHRRRWVVVQIDMLVTPGWLSYVRWDELIPQLQRLANGVVGHAAIFDRAATFEGKARVRSSAKGKRISVMLLDPV